ncbi:SPOR domain-containing protein [Gammaproteobacteria bacterium]|nr:SPOR domain-containing protein [Gammaproteobacteria bacterium]
MTFERLVGLFFFIGSILILVITFYPETNSFIANDDSKDDKNATSNININSNDNLPDNFKNFSISDFDLFVYRAHVLSSKENSEAIVNMVNDGGLPAFFEAFEENNKLFAVYVGPFVSESDIVNNMDTIKRLSESQNGEILRWKLSD